MAGLLGDSVTAGQDGMRGLADVSAVNTGLTLQNDMINAKKEAANFELAGQAIGAAIGSIWGHSGMGAKIGKHEGAKWGGIVSGTGPQGSEGGGGGDGQAAIFGSVLNYLGQRQAAAHPSGAAPYAGNTEPGYSAPPGYSSSVGPLPNTGGVVPTQSDGGADTGYSNGYSGVGDVGNVSDVGDVGAVADVGAAAGGD